MNNAQRRTFLLASSALLAIPLTSFAQPAERVRRIGFLSGAAPGSPLQRRRVEEFTPLMRRIGYEEGKNLVIDWRFVGGKDGDPLAGAQELVRLNVELIVADIDEVIAAAQKSTRTIPIVMWFASLPTELGFVESFARPGGNITGTTWTGFEEVGKILQLLREAAPGAKKIAALWNPSEPFGQRYREETKRAASALGMDLQFFNVTRPEDIRPALERIAAARPDALYVDPARVMLSGGREIAAFAIERKLISASVALSLTIDGLLFHLGPQRPALDARTASFVDRILRGAKPSDLPVEGPTKYELVVNSKTAQAIGFKSPPLFAHRVDRMIE